MDGAIRIGRWCIGLDPLPDLLPGPGDLIGVLISMGRSLCAPSRAGIRRIAIARMMAKNITIDTPDRPIPLLHDAFDFAYLNNARGTGPSGESSNSTLTITNRTVPKAGIAPNLRNG